MSLCSLIVGEGPEKGWEPMFLIGALGSSEALSTRTHMLAGPLSPGVVL